MTNFKILLAQSKQTQQARAVKEKQHGFLLSKAFPLSANQINLPGDKTEHNATDNQAADYVQGKTDKKPFALKFKKSDKPFEKKSFSQLLARGKSQQSEQTTSKRNVLYGTGLTKKEVKKAVTLQEKSVDPNVFPGVSVEVLDKIIKKQIPEQPPIVNLQTPSDIVWDEYQLAALTGLRTQKYACLIGAAGTGKTTVTKQIVKELEEFVPTIDLNNAKLGSQQSKKPEYNVAICFCAFTGRAVQQMKRPLPKAYHPLCNTIHSTLGYAPTFETYFDEKTNDYKDKMVFKPTFTRFNKLPFKICIVDEAGMVPIKLWNELIEALLEECKVILIGDINQLPPVQGRSVLGFAMLKWPTYTLEHIHRQAADNPIIANAHKILQGFFPQKDLKKFAILTLPDGSIAAQNKTLGIVQQLHQRDLFDPFLDALIVPQNTENLGQIALNEKLVHYFNPLKEENGVMINKRTIITAGYVHVHFAVNDKVMLLQNDRQRELTNGMIGRVIAINANGMYDGNRSDHSQVKFDGEIDTDLSSLNDTESSDNQELDNTKDDESQRQASHVMTVLFGEGESTSEVPFSTAGQFRTVTLAYAFTCHKSQGGEYRNVVIVVHASNIRMLTREWLYTAVTRARERVILLSNDRGLAQSIHVQRIKGRTVKEKAQQFLDLQDKKETRLPELPEPTKWEN